MTGNANNTTFPNASSVTLQGSIAVNNLDGSALAANTSFTGISGNAGLLTGNQPLTAGQRVGITFTVRVNYASGNVPTATRNNTAYATSASQTNPGYTQDANGNLISPTGLQAMDASTNSNDATYYPPSRTSAAADTPSPTPLTFTPGLFGTVFEDVNYGGGAGRTLAASSGVARPNTRVELYSGSGTSATFLSATTTNASGAYSFTNLTVGGSYVVRVVNNSTQAVSSSRTGATSSLLPVQTYAYNADATTAASRVGGQDPQRVDAANVTSVGTTLASLSTTGSATSPGTIAQSLSAVTLPSSSASSTAGVDFGFNFDVVTNTNDKGQGSLRQFILNSNALGGESSLAQSGANSAGSLAAGQETSIFMIPDGAVHPGLLASANGGPASQLSSGVAAIAPASMLPAVTGVSTTIDGTTQTQNIGNTNNVPLGTGGTVGTAATALGQLNGPEVQLKGTRSYEGLSLTANSVTVRGLSVYGFTNDIGVGTDYTGTLIEQNVLGTSATSFTDPGANVRTTQQGINYYNADNGTLRNNLIGFNGGMGIWVIGDVNGANSNTISGNEIRGNALEVNINGEGLVFDGLELQGASTGNTVSGNLITASLGHGIDSYGNAIGGNTITGNTISNNGQGIVNNNSGVEGSGLRIYGATNTTTISNNILSGNNGSGVLVENTAAKVVISQNSISGNTRVGIDLLSNADANTTSNTYNGLTGTTSNVTLNSATTTGGNSLLNYPIITSATVVGTNLLVQGYAKSTASIELFIAQANASAAATPNDKFGQGLTYLTTLTEGATSGVADTDTRTGLTYGASGATINGVNQGTDTNANGFSFLVPLTTAQQATVTAGTLLTSTATLGGATSEFSGNATTTVTAPLTGYVYEDVNYGGGAGRSRATAGTSAVTRPGAKVELYDSNGNYVSTAITDANGQYSFSAVPGSYTVRVVNNSVVSSRGQAASTYSGDATSGYTNTLLPVQTYNGTTTRVGGQNPAYTDAPANTGTQALSALTSGTTLPESIATITVAQGASTNAGPDFGYNFDLVVNTSNAGQGSLRQFIANASALGGESSLAQSGSRVDATGTTQPLPAGKETSIFMIPDGAAHAGLLASTNGGPVSQLTSSGVAQISAASTLTLTGTNAANTVLDGTTQTANIGNINTGTATNTSTRTVGTDAVSLMALQKPEVELVGTNIASVLDLEAATSTVRGLAVHGSTSQDILVGSSTASTGYVLENLLIGTAPDGTRPGSNATGNYGIYLGGSAGVGTTQNALVAFTGNSGIDIANGTGTAGTTQILSSFFTKNGYVSSGGDGITIGDKALAGPVNIAGNSFSFTNSSGIQFEIGSTSASTVTNNTIDNAGNISDAGAANANLEGSAIDYLQRDGNRRGAQADVISKNVLTNTAASGIVIGYGQQNVTLSQNSIYNSGTSATNGSGKVGIDLIGSNQSVSSNNGVYGMGDGVTLNDGNSPASATADLANRGVDFPVITSAVVTGGNLVVSGYSRPGAVIELFNPGSPTNATNFGEGQTYLGTVTEGATTGIVDNDAGTGSYAGTQPNGLNEGTDTGASRFSFTIPLTGKFAGYTFNSLLSGTATLNNSTSEFSGIVRVTTPPVPNDATNASIPNNTTTPVALNPSLSGTAYGNTANVTTATATTIASYTVSLPSSGTLYYNNVALTGPTTVAANNLANLKFVPAFGSTGSATFTYTTTDTDGLTSTQHNTSGTSSNGPATYTIPLAQSADVTTALAGPTQVNAGQPVTYTATFTNNGAQTANGVTRVITLPSGATLTSAQIAALPSGAAYNSGTNTITYSALTTLASGSSSAVSFTFTAPTAVGTATLTSTVGTNGTPDQGVNAAPDVAALTLNVTEVANVMATVTAASTPVAVGSTGTFNVVFKNSGPQTANGTTFAVQLPAGLSGVSVTNASGTVIGSYNSTTGLVTLTSPPTAIAPAGQLPVNISFSVPANGLPVTATATVTTTTSEAGQTTDNVASATIASSSAFDLTTSLTGPNSVMTGNTGTLYVTTTNNGPSAASGVVQTVSIGTGLSTANLFISNGGTYDSNSGVVTFPTLATLPSGQTVGNTISFVIPAASVTFEPTATVTPNTTGAGETNIANNTARLNGAAANTAAAQVTTTARTGATVNVYTAISTTAQIVTPGSAIVYTVVAGNAGNTTATAADVTTSVQLLPGLTGTTLTLGGNTGTAGTGANANSYSYTFNDNGGTSRTATYNSTTGLVSISTISGLASGSSRSFALAMTPPASVIGNGGQILATSSVTTNLPDAMPADNLDAVRVLVSPAADLATVVTGPTSTVAGLPVTYGITFSSNGPSLGTSVVETAQLPRNLTSVTILDNTGAAVSGATYSATTGLVTFPAQTTLAAGASQAYTVSFAAPNTALYPVSAAISGSTADGNSANNSSSVTTTTSALADVMVAVSGPASAAVGNPVTYDVTTTNNGPSAAASVSTTLQLPSGVAQANVLAAPAGTTYSVSGGITTAMFTSVSSLASGASVGNYLTFSMPNATTVPATGIATVATTTTESNAGNNQQAVQTDVAPATTTTADLSTSIAYSGNPTTVAVGTSLTLTATFTNNSTAAVGSVVPRIYLPAGLSLTSITSDAALGTGTYDSSTGMVTFVPITMAAGASLNATIVLPAPASGPVAATASIASNTTDPTPANNVASASVAITPAYDEVTTISGPASALPASTAVYTVQTINNGPTASTSAVTQTVTLPSGVTVVAGSISGNGTVSGSTITWTIPTGQAAGANGIVTNTFAVTAPAVATTSYVLNASVTAPGESNTGNNTASVTTTRTNQPPVALNVTNMLQSPQSNTAGPLLISPLVANDPQSSALTYKLTSLPTASSQGVLSYNDGTANGAYTNITTSNYPTLSLSAAQIATLKFDPVSTFVGNVFFTYTATDALSLTSNEALYTIRVGQDNNSTYTVAAAKGGSNPYQNADVLATAFDWNGGRYTSAGAISPTNGIDSATLTSGSLPAGTTLYTVPTTVGGVTYSAGQVVVTDRTKLVAGSYPLTVQTVDANGGVNTVSFTITIGAFPLPVTLVAFTAQAVQNRDALLNWSTASEVNNDHFEVERSFDGTSFAKIGQVAGHGTTSAASAYTLTDANVAAKASGPVYYRLRQVDFNGAATFSPVRTVSFTKAATVSLSLYPNPAQASTTLDLSELPATGTYQVQLLDATGRTVRATTLAGGLPQPLDVHELATGAYLLLVTGRQPDGSALKQTLRLTKE